MSFIDALIPLVIGLLLIVRPQAFVKKTSSPEVIARRSATLRKVGYVLLGVALLYSVIAVVES